MCAKLFVDPKLFDRVPVSAQIIFNWTTFFHYLELDSIFETFPKFDSTNPLFVSYVEALSTPTEQNALYDLYDHLFKECLIQVKTLEQIEPTFLIERIQSAKERSVEPFREVLEQLETSFLHDPQNMMHSLILYLSWDRFCICLARLFDYQTEDKVFLANLEVFKDCVIESFHHIKQHGRTSPSFVRLMEALFFYEMREEKLQRHQDEDWKTLNHGFSLFNAPEKLADVPYMSVGVPGQEEFEYLTTASSEKIQADLALTDYFIRRVQADFPDWSFGRSPIKFTYPVDPQ